MLQTQKHSQQIVGFLLGVAILSLALGATSTLLGNRLIRGTEALERNGEGNMKNMERRNMRKERRLQRLDRVLGDLQTTYPMQTSMLLRDNLSRKWEVALDQGTLTYPRLRITAPISKPSLAQWKQRNWHALEDQMQFGLLHGVVTYPHSPEPGGAGNIIIAGHSAAPTIEAQSSPYRDVFEKLLDAKRGDVIELRSEGSVYSYEVYGTDIVHPTQTSILLQEKNVKELTLFTCYPVGTTQDRFVVKAKLKQGQPAVAARSSGS